MHRVLLSALILVACMSPCHAADPRLGQMITYQGGYKRLHAIAEELTKQTGVTIRAGSGSQDWRVRDIPLIVCVKDMPLGKLLKTIANTAHVTLAMEKIANAKDEKPGYRLCRTREQQQRISSATNTRLEANRKLAAWTWDTLAAYADFPQTSGSAGSTPEYDATQARALGQALKELGPSAKARVLAGETLVEEMGKNAKSAALRGIYDYAATHAPESPYTIHNWPDGPTVDLELGDNTPAGPTGLKIGLCDIHTQTPDATDGNLLWYITPAALAREIASDKKLNLPAEPDTKSAFAEDDPFPEKGFVSLNSDDDWKAALLQDKMKLGSMDDPRRPADILYALATAGRISIVCEDFVSHNPDIWRPGISDSTETTPAAVLRSAFDKTEVQDRWFVNADRKLVVGWACDWATTHQALIPEVLYESVTTKMNGDGAELDDVMPLVELTPAQLHMWLGMQDHQWSIVAAGDSIVWATRKLYNALTEDQKAAARSDAGLPLGSLDGDWLVSLISRERKAYDSQSSRLHKPGGPLELEVALKSPTSVGALSFRVCREDSKTSPERHAYDAVLVVHSRGALTDLWRARLLNISFPMLSLRRQARVRKEAESNPADKKPVGQ